MTLPALPAGPVVVPLVDALAALLADVPARGDPGAADRAAERLDRLEYEARWQNAGETALAAIAGTRLILGLGPVIRIAAQARP